MKQFFVFVHNGECVCMYVFAVRVGECVSVRVYDRLLALTLLFLGRVGEGAWHVLIDEW